MAMTPLGAIPLINAMRLGPDATALKHGNEVVSWGELDRRSTRRAWALHAAGVSQDDLVTMALPNGALFYEVAFAVWKLGATPHVVSWRLPHVELAAILDVAKPRLLLSTERLLVEGLGARDPTMDLLDGGDGPLPPRVSKHWKAMSSGGSTGRPKIILDQGPGEVDIESTRLGIPHDDVILNTGPLYHNGPFGATHRALFSGSAVVGMLKFDPEEALRLIDENRVSWVNFVPTMMHRIWRLPPAVRERYDLSSLKAVWHMAAPMPAWLKECWIEWLGPERIFELYGGTEGQGLTVIRGDEWLAHRGSVGRPKDFGIRILDERGTEVPTGEVGEIYMLPARGQGSTYRYLGAEPRSTDGGYESIGDFGLLDGAGYLYIADRRTDLILSGGANIYPAEVEATLMEHPGVEVAVVIGLPHEDLGAVVHAIVKPQADYTEPFDEAVLSAFVAARLARYKTPRSYEFTLQALRDDAGKVRRTQLREERLGPVPQQRT
jgi:bile acid-coenzyme A ligase